MDIKELYWLAGLIEGEGCFTINTTKDYGGRKPRLRFAMNMIDKDVLQYAQKLVNIGSITGPYKRKVGKAFWQWQIYKERDVAALMMTIYPLMWNRRQEIIEDLLEIWREDVRS